MTNNKELKKCIGMFCPHYHGFVSWPCPSYVLELWCQNCTFYSVGWAVLCTMARSSTGYGTRRARGGRYVHLQHLARTATDYTDSAGRDMQRLYFLCYLMLNVLTCYIKWWWPDAADGSSGQLWPGLQISLYWTGKLLETVFIEIVRGALWLYINLMEGFDI